MRLPYWLYNRSIITRCLHKIALNSTQLFHTKFISLCYISLVMYSLLWMYYCYITGLFYCSLLQNKQGVYIVRASQSAVSRMVVIFLFLFSYGIRFLCGGTVSWNGALYKKESKRKSHELCSSTPVLSFYLFRFDIHSNKRPWSFSLDSN